MPHTRTELAALTALHQHGHQRVRSQSPRLRSLYATETERYSARILTALTVAGLARWSHGNEFGPHTVEPVVNVYATGDGIWHVEVPATVRPDDRAAVARAVILGEARARSARGTIPGWRPRVRHDDALCARLNADGAFTRCAYREV